MRAPVWFYRLGLGWLLGRRFLLLEHTGRRSGRTRQTVLEVAGHEAATDTYYVASGWGPGSDWYQNLRHAPEARIQVGARKLAVRAELLSPEACGRAMVDYARRHPLAAKRIAQFCGCAVDCGEADYFAMGRDAVPFVALHTTAAVRRQVEAGPHDASFHTSADGAAIC